MNAHPFQTKNGISKAKMPKFICFVGTDGAGKTTLARAFNARQKQVHQLEYQYFAGGAYYTYLMRPIRKLASRSKLKQIDEFKNYEKYQTTKKEIINANGLKKKLYKRFLIFDYGLLIFLKVFLPLLTGSRITAARYIYDVAIKFKILLHLDDEETHKIIRQFTRFMPTPNHVFLIDIPEEVALERKTDVPSLAYLTERRQLYQQVMQPYVTAVLDGRRPIAELLAEVEESIGIK